MPIKGEYKKILWEVFDVLGFFDHEKEKALEGFKKKFANQLLMEVKESLSDEQKDWIAGVAIEKKYDKNDPQIIEIQKAINQAYPKEKMDEISENVFKKILSSYIGIISQKIDQDKAEKLNGILSSL